MKKTVSVAPMMDCTDKHEIYFLSLISKNIHLYSEMIVANAIIRGDRDKLLSFKKISNPVTLQIGGSNPDELAEACKISTEELEQNAIKRLRKEPDEDEQQEDIEEETNDDFENLYKGQISKSGVAILPSKRTRRVPEIKKPASSNLAKEALSELKAEQPEIKEENLETEEAPLELSEEAPAQEENKTE